uniref:Uncharacterized protein n=1 Tax=Arundo donax TaxID=35708 RepID=A0A0A9FH24_ARUDO
MNTEPGRMNRKCVMAAPCTPTMTSDAFRSRYILASSVSWRGCRTVTRNPAPAAARTSSASFSIARDPFRETITSRGFSSSTALARRLLLLPRWCCLRAGAGAAAAAAAFSSSSIIVWTRPR